MKLSFTDYNSLVSALTDMQIVVEDSLLSDDAKNVVFRATPSGVVLNGVNRLITYRIPLDVQYVEADTDECMQIRSKELLNFLSSYKTLSQTQVVEVNFETQDNLRAKCTVVEQLKNSSDEAANTHRYTSSWVFDNIPIPTPLLKSLDTTVPTSDRTELKVEDLKWFTDNLLPSLSSSLDAYSNMLFTDKKCIVLNQSYTIIADNSLGITDWNTLKLSHRVMQFINKNICNTKNKDKTVRFIKTDRNLYIELEDGSQVFLTYTSQLPPYQVYLDMIDTTHMVKVDRKYLRDILKRVSLLKEPIMVDIDCNDHTLTFRNTKFNQSIDMADYKEIDGYDNIRFKIMPDVIDKIMIGSDKNNDYLYIYYNVSQGNHIILFSDESNRWFSIVRVKIY